MTLTGMKKHVRVLEDARLVAHGEGRAGADLPTRARAVSDGEAAWIAELPADAQKPVLDQPRASSSSAPKGRAS